MKQGLIYVFTGEGKGKTSAALGTLVRGIGSGWRVGWVSFYKEPQWKLSEFAFLDYLTTEARSRVDMQLMGKGFYLSESATAIGNVKVVPVNEAVVVDDDSAVDHKNAASQALQLLKKMVQSQEFELVVMDEVCNAIADKLIEEQALIQILQQRGKTHLVLTGRNASDSLIQVVDLASQINKIKHPFDKGQNAVRGLDF